MTATSTSRPIRRLAGLVALVALAASHAAASGDEPVWVGRFDGGLAPWQEVRLNADLKPNRFAVRSWDGVPALEVQSRASMSLLARPLAVDLARTPVLCWRWRVDAPLQGADMGRKSGDDYAARLYVSLALPEADKSLALRAKLRIARSVWGPSVPDAAINYVWDNRHPVGTERPNAYTDRTTMVVLRSGPADAGAWVQERRHVGRDIARLHGPSATPVQIALTADTDNTGESARAGFADLHWVTDSSDCATRPT